MYDDTVPRHRDTDVVHFTDDFTTLATGQERKMAIRESKIEFLNVNNRGSAIAELRSLADRVKASRDGLLCYY